MMPTYDFFEHFRFQALCNILRDMASPESVYGHVARLEAHLVHDRNDIDRQRGIIDPKEIEPAAHWYANPGVFLSALAGCGLVIDHGDGRVRMRGWEKHAPYFVKRRITCASQSVDALSQTDDVLSQSADTCTVRGQPMNCDGSSRVNDGSSRVNVCRPKSQSQSKSKSKSREKVNQLTRSNQCHQCQRTDTDKNSEGKFAVCTDADDAEQARDVDADANSSITSKRTRNAIVKLFSSAGITDEQLRQWGPLGVAVLLDACGVKDVGFRAAVGSAMKHNPRYRKDFLELCGMIYAKKETIKTPAAWLRKSLRQRGLEI